MLASDCIAEITDYLENSPTGNASNFSFSKESLSALYSLAYELYRNGKYEDAKGFFRVLTLVDSFDRRYWMGLGACFQMLKKYAEAIQCYSAAALQNPLDPYVHWHAADCFFHSGNLIEAKKALDSALIVAKENSEYGALIPKIELIALTWNHLLKEGVS